VVRALLVVAILGALAAPSSAQDTSASGSLGAGMFGSSPATTVDVGVDLVGDEVAIGLGGRFRWVGSGFRSEDWDDRSDLARIARYVTFVHRPEAEGDLAVTVAGGALGGTGLGHGSIIGGYTSGLDVDHQRFGIQMRADKERYGVEAMVDDAVAPRIGGLRGSLDIGEGRVVGMSLAADGSAPVSMTTELVSIVGLDVEQRFAAVDERRSVTMYADAVAVLGTGMGLHAGMAGDFTVSDHDVTIGARVEARAGTSRYVPTWVGPLYEVARHGQLDAADAGDLGGMGGLAAVSVEVPYVGAVDVSYAGRSGLPDVLTARASAPYYHGVQAAAWTAVELADGGAAAAAAELRARLPWSMFVSLEAARLYEMRDMQFESLWIATAALGGVLGE
jgi:hypothetical protein